MFTPRIKILAWTECIFPAIRRRGWNNGHEDGTGRHKRQHPDSRS